MFVFFFKQKTAYEMRISDWSSDVCSSDLRELDLDPAWTNSYDPTERWWGVEVEFPSTLDEVFGVTNTKQSATIFSHMAQFDWKAEANPGESRPEERRVGQECVGT